MKQHTVTITLSGNPDTEEVKITAKFDPPMRAKGESNCPEGVAARMIRSIGKAEHMSVDGTPVDT